MNSLPAEVKSTDHAWIYASGAVVPWIHDIYWFSPYY